MRLRTPVAYLGFWTLVGLFFASETYLAGMVVGRPVPWGAAIAWSLPGWYVWALLAPGIVRLGARGPDPLGPAGVRGDLPRGGALAALAHAAIAVAAERLMGLGQALALGYGAGAPPAAPGGLSPGRGHVLGDPAHELRAGLLPARARARRLAGCPPGRELEIRRYRAN